MPQTFHLPIKPSFVERKKTLSLTPDFIEYGGLHFAKLDIEGIRYGIQPIKGYRFRIGRIYCIDIKGPEEKIIRIRLKSVYRIRRKMLGTKYKQIVESLFENFINDLSLSYFRNFNDGLDVNILGNVFTQAGVIFEKSKEVVPWNDLGTRNYYGYFSLFSKKHPDNYRAFVYLRDWNTVVLRSVSNAILDSKQPL